MEFALASWAVGIRVALACQPFNPVDSLPLEAPLWRVFFSVLRVT